MEVLMGVGCGRILVSVGALLSVLGLVITVHSLYLCIPFEGETLQSRRHDVIGYQDRIILRRRGIWGLWLYFASMMLIAVGVWLF